MVLEDSYRKGTMYFYYSSCFPELTKMVNKLLYINQWNNDSVFSMYVLGVY